MASGKVIHNSDLGPQRQPLTDNGPGSENGDTGNREKRRTAATDSTPAGRVCQKSLAHPAGRRLSCG